MNKKFALLVVMFFFASVALAQRASVSIDMMKSAMAIPNITVEVLLSKRLTFNLETVINPFDEVYGNLRTKQITITPEVRYWFKRPMYSHFVGLNLMGSNYDVGLGDNQYKGKILALGLVYGYSLYISERWTFTPTIGIGCGYGINTTTENGVVTSLNNVGIKPVLTKLGFNLTYLIN